MKQCTSIQFHNCVIPITLVSAICVSIFNVGVAYLVDKNPYRHLVYLDMNGKYELEWLVDWSQRRITFNVTVQTTGYVGFGLVKSAGKMTGADIIIGGVYPSGKSYFTDRHATGNLLPEVDYSQDWKLHLAHERDNQTFLSFSRPFETCDTNYDLPITVKTKELTDSVITLIWAYGDGDDRIQYHFQNRGTYNAYLLDPDLTPRSIDPLFSKEPNQNAQATKAGRMEMFAMRANMTMQPQDMVYWCTFHQVPTTTKHHIIGFNTYFPAESDQKHVNYILLHRCHSPEGIDSVSLFENAANSEGSECYFLTDSNPLPTQYCKETIYAWAIGGRAIFFPDHVGLSMSEFGSEYFMLQIHYDNPHEISNLNVTVELQAYYTSNLRKNDIGMLQMGDLIPGSTSILIPPSSSDHVIIGHCAPGCTERMIPDDGVSVFASLLHTHISGRNVRFLHHRGNQELPWILYDDNYKFNYQQFRILKQERRLFPGDHLMHRCAYDTTNRNDSVVTGGFASSEEACGAFLYYYPRFPGFALCRSEIRTKLYWNLLGIQNTTWNESRRETIITSPAQFYGLGITEFANNHIEWNTETREAIKRHHQFDPQVSQCPRVDIPLSKISSSESSTQRQPITLKHSRRFPMGYTRSVVGTRSEAQTDDSMEYLSVNPRGISRFRRPVQCSGDSKSITRYKPKGP